MTWQFAAKMSGFEAVMYATVYKLLYYLNIGVCWLVDLFYNIFDKLAGVCKAVYQGDAELLGGLLFTNGAVSTIFWCMALVCIVLSAAFTVFVLVRRRSEEAKLVARPVKDVFLGFGKTTLTVLSMTLAIVILLNATGILMQQARFSFLDAQEAQQEVVEFSDEEFAAMARVLNTIGNYSLNPIYNNRYNINSCFNEIRPDMQYLSEQGVFRYDAESLQDETVATWQMALQRIAETGSLSRELKIDLYYEDVTEAILDTMELMRINGDFKPLENYKFSHNNPNTKIPVDRALFLTATLDSAKNEDLNAEPSLTDSLRYSYYYGEKSIYDLDVVNEGFDIGSAAIEFLLFTIGGLMLLKSLLVLIFNFIARIFNMLMLYLFAIPTVAGGDKENIRKWLISFTVHALSSLAMLVLIRVMLILLPCLLTSDMAVFGSPTANALVKLSLLLLTVRIGECISCLITSKLAEREALHSVFTDERPKGNATILLKLSACARFLRKLTKQMISACAFTGEPLQTRQVTEEEPEEAAPCDELVLKKYNSWTNI